MREKERKNVYSGKEMYLYTDCRFKADDFSPCGLFQQMIMPASFLRPRIICGIT